MLLSFHKPVTASSVKDDFSVEKLVDEDVRTAWVANSNQEEWVQIDLLNPCKVYAIQVNYDEYGANQKGIVPDVYQSYVLSASKNGKDWYVIADKSRKKQIPLMTTSNLKFRLTPVISSGKTRPIQSHPMFRYAKYVSLEKVMGKTGKSAGSACRKGFRGRL